jgi:hypothetical protein
MFGQGDTEVDYPVPSELVKTHAVMKNKGDMKNIEIRNIDNHVVLDNGCSGRYA